MVQIYYNTENIEGHNRLEFIDFTENDNSVHYDIEKLPDENIFLRDIKFEDGDSDLRLCVTTMSNKVYCYYQNVYNLNLPQIKRSVIGKKTTPIPKDIQNLKMIQVQIHHHNRKMTMNRKTIRVLGILYGYSYFLVLL